MTITLGIFYLLSILGIVSGILTIIMGKNPINSVVFLVSCFGNCSLIFILIGVDLLGFIYIIVYVGAIAILFIFVIMMMDLRITETKISGKNSFLFTFYNYPLILLVVIISTLIIINPLENLFKVPSIPTIEIINNYQPFTNFSGNLEKLIFNDFTTWEITQRNIWETLIQNSMSNIIQSVGYLLYTDFLSLLLLASLILLMVMISVIILIPRGE